MPIDGAVVADKASSTSSHGRRRLLRSFASRDEAELGFHTKASLLSRSTLS